MRTISSTRTAAVLSSRHLSCGKCTPQEPTSGGCRAGVPCSEAATAVLGLLFKRGVRLHGLHRSALLCLHA